MAKLKLIPDPSFSAPVPIPLPGAEPVPVVFTFKHRSRDELNRLIEESKGMKDVDLILACASGWELADTFNAESVGLLVQNYIAAPRVVYETYLRELVKAREKN